MLIKKPKFASSRAFIILLIDKLLCITAITVLLWCIYFHKEFIKIFLVFIGSVIVYQVGVVIFQYKYLIRPIRELEKTASLIENRELLSESNYLNNLSKKENMNEIDKLINCVKSVIKDDYKSQMLKAQAEMHALQSQINPHFLYNTLETIRSHAIAQHSAEIAEMTEALATLFRYSISKPGELATFSEEIENVKNYLTIQQYRFPSKIRFEKVIEDSSISDYRIPILTIQPIVENAIHHGLETKMGSGVISIRAFCTHSRLIISIIDDGLGMSEEKLMELEEILDSNQEDVVSNSNRHNKKAGIALINVNQRIKFYFGPEYGLKIRSTLGVGTTVEIVLPITESEKVKSSEARGITS